MSVCGAEYTQQPVRCRGSGNREGHRQPQSEAHNEENAAAKVPAASRGSTVPAM